MKISVQNMKGKKIVRLKNCGGRYDWAWAEFGKNKP